MAGRGTWMVAATGAWLALLVGGAHATVRYVTVGGSTTDASCSTAVSPCALTHAVQDVALAGDEVVVAPGTYVVEQLEINQPIDVHGAAGQPRPTITCCSFPFTTATVEMLGTPGAHLHDLVVERTGGGLALRSGSGALLDRLVVRATGATVGGIGVDTFGPTGLLRDSVVTADGPGSIAIDAEGAQGGLQQLDLRNVTAIAHGTGASGLATSGFFDGFSTRSRRTTLVNCILRGDAQDLSITSDSQGSAGVVASHSNYRAAAVQISGPLATLTDAGGNQTAADPVFVDAAGGDFHEQLTSPTVDAGAVDPDMGGVDLEGNARTQGSAPDIGAFETALPAATPAPTVIVAPAPAPAPAPGDVTPPTLKVSGLHSKMRLKTFLRGITVTATPSERASIRGSLIARARGATFARVGDLVLGERSLGLGSGARKLRLTPRRSLVGHPRRLRVSVQIVATDAAGNSRTVTKTISVRR